MFYCDLETGGFGDWAGRIGLIKHPVAAKPMEVPYVIRGMVGYLAIDALVNGVLQRVNVGTGFFVTKFHDETETKASNYLVTAKHVWRDWIKDAKTAYVRLNCDDPPQSPATYAPLHTDWRFHSDPTVDLAVLPWVPIPGLGAGQGGFYTLEVSELRPPQQVLDRLKKTWPPEPGEPLYMVGLLSHHAGRQRILPVVRVGHLAMTTDELITGTLGPSHYYLADLQTYPGHSGAPVWINIGDLLYLLGVMVGGLPVPQHVVTKTQNGTTVVEQHHALGISLVVPVEKMLEILMSPEVVKDRQKTGIDPDHMKTVVPTSNAPSITQADEGITKADFESALRKVSRKLSDEEKSGT